MFTFSPMTAAGGLDGFLNYLSRQAQAAPPGYAGAAWFILRIGEECAYIRLQDIGQPLRFLRQMAGNPPLRFGVAGFSPDLVDDANPARHYIAFVFVGFWLPRLPALALLYAWEVAGFIRYRGEWSRRDVRSGLIGLRHGRWVRACGPAVLPGIAAGELATPSTGPATPSTPAAASRR